MLLCAASLLCGVQAQQVTPPPTTTAQTTTQTTQQQPQQPATQPVMQPQQQQQAQPVQQQAPAQPMAAPQQQQQQPVTQQQPAHANVTTTTTVQQPVMQQQQQQPGYYGQQSQSQFLQTPQTFIPISARLSAHQLQSMRAAHQRANILSSEIQMTCPDPSICGIQQGTSLADVLFRHTDLSLCASHASWLSFLHPLLQRIDAQANYTIVLPTATTMQRAMEYGAQRFCSPKSAYAEADACKFAVALRDVDRVVLDNSVALAKAGTQQFMQGQWSMLNAHK